MRIIQGEVATLQTATETFLNAADTQIMFHGHLGVPAFLGSPGHVFFHTEFLSMHHSPIIPTLALQSLQIAKNVIGTMVITPVSAF